MNEKETLLPAPPSYEASERSTQRRSRTTWLALVSLFALTMSYPYFLLVAEVMRSIIPSRCHSSTSLEANNATNTTTLDVFIMSKCPDARDCIDLLILPTMANLSTSTSTANVNLTISYIGSVSPISDNISCKHGQSECLGNMIELCAAHIYPSPKQYLGFLSCMGKNYQDIPDRDLVSDCALEYGMDFDKINECLSRDDGAFAMDLVRNSMLRSQEEEVKISCTVKLNGKERCVRDDGKWKDCDRGSKPADLIKDIEHPPWV